MESNVLWRKRYTMTEPAQGWGEVRDRIHAALGELARDAEDLRVLGGVSAEEVRAMLQQPEYHGAFRDLSDLLIYAWLMKDVLWRKRTTKKALPQPPKPDISQRTPEPMTRRSYKGEV